MKAMAKKMAKSTVGKSIGAASDLRRMYRWSHRQNVHAPRGGARRGFGSARSRHHCLPGPPGHPPQLGAASRSGCELSPAAQPLALRASISAGSTLCTSPTMPRSATEKMGASESLLMAMMFLDPFIPTRCWVAPEIPHAM